MLRAHLDTPQNAENAIKAYHKVLRNNPEIAQTVLDDLLKSKQNAQAVHRLLRALHYQGIDTDKTIEVLNSWRDVENPVDGMAIRQTLWALGDRSDLDETRNYYFDQLIGTNLQLFYAGLQGLQAMQKYANPALPRLRKLLTTLNPTEDKFQRLKETIAGLEGLASSLDIPVDPVAFEVEKIVQRLKSPGLRDKLMSLMDLSVLQLNNRVLSAVWNETRAWGNLRPLDRSASKADVATTWDKNTVDALMAILDKPGPFFPGTIRKLTLELLAHGGAHAQEFLPTLIGYADNPDTLLVLMRYANAPTIRDIENRVKNSRNPGSAISMELMAYTSIILLSTVEYMIDVAIDPQDTRRKAALSFLENQHTLFTPDQKNRFIEAACTESDLFYKAWMLKILDMQSDREEEKNTGDMVTDPRLIRPAASIIQAIQTKKGRKQLGSKLDEAISTVVMMLENAPIQDLNERLSPEEREAIKKYCEEEIVKTDTDYSASRIERTIKRLQGKVYRTEVQLNRFYILLAKLGEPQPALKQIRQYLKAPTTGRDLRNAVSQASFMASSIGPAAVVLIPDFQRVYCDHKEKTEIKLIAAATLWSLFKLPAANSDVEVPPTSQQGSPTAASIPSSRRDEARSAQETSSNIARAVVTEESSSDHLAQNVATRLAEALGQEVDLTDVDADILQNIQEALENGGPQAARDMLAHIGIRLSTNSATRTTQTAPNNNAAVEALYGGALTFASPAMAVAF